MTFTFLPLNHHLKIMLVLAIVLLVSPLVSASQIAPYYIEAERKFDDFPALPRIFSALKPDKKFDNNVRELVKTLKDEHFIHPDPVAEADKIFEKYIDAFDPQKRIFTQSDIAWIQALEKSVTKSITSGKAKPIYKIHNQYRKRFAQVMLAYIHLIDHHRFNFHIDETIHTSREDLDYPADYDEWIDLRRKELKNILLGRLVDGGDYGEITVALRKRYVNRLNFFLEGKADEVLDLFANAMVSMFDPHSRYLTPDNYKAFKEDHSLRLEGIGAFIGSKEDYIEVFRTVEGGPAKRSGEIFAGDRIIGVAEGDDDFKDVVGMSTSNVVKLIRGPKGSVVRLEILPAGKSLGHRSRIVYITRDVITQKDKRAYRQTMTIPGIERAWKIGVITVESFYGSFDNSKTPSASEDVRNLVLALKEEEVDGIVLDLRGNGGGLLTEALRMASIFLPRGPVVKIKQRNSRTSTHGSLRSSTAWHGPLAVLVDRLSASASEIVAAALQDYNRALIIGDTTYGKGTVQSPLDIDNGKHGRVFLTISKFYRINGGSTQNKGVIPDIQLASIWNHEDIGESSLENPLNWDSIEHANYRVSNLNWHNQSSFKNLQLLHKSRQQIVPYLSYLNDIIESNEESEANVEIPLEIDKRRDWIELERLKILEAQNNYHQSINRPLFDTWEELEDFRDEERKKEHPSGTPADKEIRAEAGRILVDSINSPTFAQSK